MTSVQAQAVAAARQHDLQNRSSGTSKAALTGATLAFNRPETKPQPRPKPRQLTSARTSIDSNAFRSIDAQKNEDGTSLSRRSSVSSHTSAASVPASAHSTGNISYADRSTDVDHGALHKSTHLQAPSVTYRAMSPHSPSNIAAGLAAARLSPRPQIKPKNVTRASSDIGDGQQQESVAVRKLRARQASIHRRTSETSLDGTTESDHTLPKGTDASSIPSTNALVNMFEHGNHTEKARRTKSPTWEVKKPTPKSLSTKMVPAPQDSAAARKLRARQASISRRRESDAQDDITGNNSGKSEPTDASSIAPTSSLIQAFEQGAQPNSQKAVQSSEPNQRKRAIVGAKLPQIEPVPQSKTTTDPVKATPAPKPNNYASPIESAKAAVSTRQNLLASTARMPHETSKTGHSDSSANTSAPETAAKPMPPPPRRGRSKNPHIKSPVSTPASAPISIPRRKSSGIPSLQNRRISTATSISPSPPSSLGPRPPYLQPNNYSHSSLKRISPHMSGSSIANAIIAANLSSRTPSPNPTHSIEPSPPLLPLRTEPRHHHLPFPSRRNRTTSPPKKGFRTTMRDDPSSASSDSDTNPHRRHRHRLMRKHPHKHHEGDRLRWRSSITAAERKRYEGVFASNKALLLPPPSSSSSSAAAAVDAVHGLVVRDVWSRSRLPRESLREIWDLVAGQGGVMGLEAGRTEKGCLGREEFVVGMWLIDQRLKGRKLPIKVGESVWASVRGVGGLVVPKARRK